MIETPVMVLILTALALAIIGVIGAVMLSE